jgi:hypothetical protein
VRSAFPLPVLTLLLNGLPASRPTDTRISWPLVYASGKPSYSMRYEWLKNCCVLFVSLRFLILTARPEFDLKVGSGFRAVWEDPQMMRPEICGSLFWFLLLRWLVTEVRKSFSSRDRMACTLILETILGTQVRFELLPSFLQLQFNASRYEIGEESRFF